MILTLFITLLQDHKPAGHSYACPNGCKFWVPVQREIQEDREALLACIRRVIGQGLTHQVRGLIQEIFLHQRLLHQLEGLQRHERIEMAIDSN